ncbi:MAG TPA: hypothetical protein VFA18_06255 [Gemmataceae bacterium]|nr:hypothetical protein [Gemmataceae bacterium]
MWIFTTCGFFSIVQKPNTTHLTVRSRARLDLDHLRTQYLPELSATVANAGTDYPYRATVSHEAFAKALSRIARDIDYGNFKDEVAARMGHERASVYGRIWSALLDLEQEDAT